MMVLTQEMHTTHINYTHQGGRKVGCLVQGNELRSHSLLSPNPRCIQCLFSGKDQFRTVSGHWGCVASSNSLRSNFCMCSENNLNQENQLNFCLLDQ